MLHRLVRFHNGMEQACAVHVGAYAPHLGEDPDGGQIHDGLDVAARQVVGLVNNDERCLRRVKLARLVDFDLEPADWNCAAISPWKAAQLHTSEPRRSGLPVQQAVGAGFTKGFAARRCLCEDGKQIRHRVARTEYRSLFVEHGSGEFLQSVRGGILAKTIVTHLRAGHGLAHGISGLGDRVAAKV